jgi:hypothetical protein
MRIYLHMHNGFHKVHKPPLKKVPAGADVEYEEIRGCTSKPGTVVCLVFTPIQVHGYTPVDVSVIIGEVTA